MKNDGFEDFKEIVQSTLTHVNSLVSNPDEQFAILAEATAIQAVAVSDIGIDNFLSLLKEAYITHIRLYADHIEDKI